MKIGLSISYRQAARQLVCVVLCALFVFPSLAVQPAFAPAVEPVSEEREESNKSETGDDENAGTDSINQLNRRALPRRSLIAQSIQTNTSRMLPTASSPFNFGLNDVYQNGLGTRLRC